MDNVAINDTTVKHLDTHGTDGALNAATHRDVLRNDTTLDMRAIADQKIRGAQVAFDSTEDLEWTIAFNAANNQHAGADARACFRFRRALFNDRVLPDPLANQHCPRNNGDRNKYNPPCEKGETYCV